LGRHLRDPGVDRVAMLDHDGDQFARQGCRRRIAFGLGEVAFQDGLRGPLTEVGLEDRGERESTPRPTSALPISLRRHRR
jgi:hypothetical protein